VITAVAYLDVAMLTATVRMTVHAVVVTAVTALLGMYSVVVTAVPIAAVVSIVTVVPAATVATVAAEMTGTVSETPTADIMSARLQLRAF
jgi:type IV secretory pathway protease TraF